MGFSPGEFKTIDGRSLHLEGGSRGITLWNAGESEVLMELDANEARRAADQLSLLADMLSENRL